MRVLVVEDDERLATSLERGLRSEGFEVDREADGAVGLWRASEVAYDVIVLDLLLPGLNGFKVCGELRSRGVRTPVLVLTAKDGEFDEVEALDTGADDYLRKPFSFPVLVSRLHALARRPGPGRGAGAIRCGDLSVDPESNRCWRGSVEIRLTPREGAVLSLLARRSGEPVGKADILHLVWGDDVDDPNVVEVYVGYLRRKVDAPFGASSIETLRGVGYRLRA